MKADPGAPHASAALLAAVRQAARQEQFLNVIAPVEAKRRFAAAIDLSPLAAETVTLADALGRVLAADVAARPTCRPSIAPASTVSRCGPPIPRAPASGRRAGCCSMPK